MLIEKMIQVGTISYSDVTYLKLCNDCSKQFFCILCYMYLWVVMF